MPKVSIQVPEPGAPANAFGFPFCEDSVEFGIPSISQLSKAAHSEKEGSPSRTLLQWKLAWVSQV